jgi:hypothetical protein
MRGRSCVVCGRDRTRTRAAQEIRSLSASTPGRPARPTRARSANTITRERTWTEVYSSWRAWPCLFPQHGPGKKHERRIVLADWQTELDERCPTELLRWLGESDGCRFENTGRNGWRAPRYAFKNRSADIHAIFRWGCDLIDARWTAAGADTTYVSRQSDVARLDEFIGPKR